jgi:hypothetical protein
MTLTHHHQLPVFFCTSNFQTPCITTNSHQELQQEIFPLALLLKPLPSSARNAHFFS